MRTGVFDKRDITCMYRMNPCTMAAALNGYGAPQELERRIFPNYRDPRIISIRAFYAGKYRDVVYFEERCYGDT